MDEIPLVTLVGVLCVADDWEAIELLSREYLAWLKRFLPYKTGIPHAQTFRKVFRLLKPEVLEQCFASWVASLQEIVRGVVAVDGKTALLVTRLELGLPSQTFERIVLWTC